MNGTGTLQDDVPFMGESLALTVKGKYNFFYLCVLGIYKGFGS
jgi:hypothetical protein